MSDAEFARTDAPPPVRPPTEHPYLQLVAADLEAVEAIFARQLDSEIPIIRELGHHILQGGGKRLRPALHLLAAKAIGCQDPQRIVLAAVFELIHTATLIHDDVIDSASTRRGRSSLNALRGNNVSVLMGDYLYLRSISLTLESDDLSLLRLISWVTAKMIEGELLQAAKIGELGVTESDYEEIVRLKTAHLFAACCQTAGMLARCPEEITEALRSYGMNLGMAFQIIDDLLDFTADEKVLGKPVLSDFREGKVTLPIIHLLREASPSRRDALEDRLRALMSSGGMPGAHEEIAQLVRERGGIEATRAKAESYAEAARLVIRKLPPGAVRDVLEGIPRYVLFREK